MVPGSSDDCAALGVSASIGGVDGGSSVVAPLTDVPTIDVVSSDGESESDVADGLARGDSEMHSCETLKQACLCCVFWGLMCVIGFRFVCWW